MLHYVCLYNYCYPEVCAARAPSVVSSVVYFLFDSALYTDLAQHSPVFNAQTYRRRRRELSRVGDVNKIRNYSSRRLPTDSVDNFETDHNGLHSGLTTWILIDIDNFFNNDVIMSSVLSTTGIALLNSRGNCKLGHDCRRVCSHHRHDSTRQVSRVGVGGVYWAWPTCSAVASR